MKAHGVVARFAPRIQLAIRGLVIVFHKVARVVFGAILAGISALRTKRAVKRIAVQIDSVHAQAQRSGAAAHTALLGKRHVVRFVNGGALAPSGQRSLGLTACRIQAAARQAGLRTQAFVVGPVRRVIGANVLHTRHRVGGQLLFVALAPRLQIRPGVAVVRLAHQRDRRFNDVVRRAHANVFRVV